MINSKIYKINRFYLSFFSLLIFISGCKEDNKFNQNVNFDSEIEFAGLLAEGNFVSTRDLSQEPRPLTWREFDGINFYIGEELSNDYPEDKSKFGVYDTPSGYQGMLHFVSSDDDESLNWFDIESNHIFRSWTLPWLQDVESIEKYSPSFESVEYELKDTSLKDYIGEFKWKENSYKNGKILEQFVGAVAGPLNYKENGKYVPLQFRHLVSKIEVNSFIFTGNGEEHSNYQGEITFLNVPTKFTFYPKGNPEKAEDELTAPIVVSDISSKKTDSGVTYAIVNPIYDESIPDEFQEKFEMYVCPEIDFSDVEFVIKVYDNNGKSMNNRGYYWGNFKNLYFDRVSDTDYDIGDGKDDKVLHAGEIMKIDFQVTEFGYAGGIITINNWNTRTKTITHYTHPGIYNYADFIDLLGTTNEFAEDLWKVIGEGSTLDNPDYENSPFYKKDFKIFKFYDDFSLIIADKNGYYFPSPYILDGNGFSITLYTSTTGVFGNCRDVYFKDRADHIVYVDKDGYLFYYNSETNEYLPSGSRIDGTYERYTVNMATGKITAWTGKIE